MGPLSGRSFEGWLFKFVFQNLLHARRYGWLAFVRIDCMLVVIGRRWCPWPFYLDEVIVSFEVGQCSSTYGLGLRWQNVAA